jgi:hypothetical protein
MHIELTTPWAAGSIDDMATYPHAKIIGFEIDIARVKNVIITVEFGTWLTDQVDDEGNPVPDYWQVGRIGRYRVVLDAAEYDAFLQQNAQTLQALQTALYATVQAKFPAKAAGNIV